MLGCVCNCASGTASGSTGLFFCDCPQSTSRAAICDTNCQSCITFKSDYCCTDVSRSSIPRLSSPWEIGILAYFPCACSQLSAKGRIESSHDQFHSFNVEYIMWKSSFSLDADILVELALFAKVLRHVPRANNNLHYEV